MPLFRDYGPESTNPSNRMRSSRYIPACMRPLHHDGEAAESHINNAMADHFSCWQMTAWAAANRAIGTRNGEQDT